MADSKGITVASTIGKLLTDSAGSPVSVVKMDADRSYISLPELLQRFINDSDSKAWDTISNKIDYTYTNLSLLLAQLDEETHFTKNVKDWVDGGRKLLFKPNLVNVACIKPVTHGEDIGYDACTGWAFIAALMRWFHDKLDISYHQMSVGEAGTGTFQAAALYSKFYSGGRKITTEAVFEGKSGDFYGGWGFYFARKYLSEKHPATHQDDPMQGYEESIAGMFIPPGKARDKLMVYDLNRVNDLPAKRRDVKIPDGANFKEVTINKVVIGSDSVDTAYAKDYPGSVLINVPRLKVHSQTMFTNAVKNLGIGLYSMEVASDANTDNTNWKYSFPPKHSPTIKSEIPHMPWIGPLDADNLPMRNDKGEYIVSKTAGLTGTIVDMFKALVNLHQPMVHIVDAIFTVNIDHSGRGLGVKVPAGFAFASLDALALDHLCARYLFKNMPIAAARDYRTEQKSSDFIRTVPLPSANGKNIVTSEGVDDILSRYSLFQYAEQRGLGNRKYYAVGRDTVMNAPIATLQGHLGQVVNGEFQEIITKELYYAVGKPLWDIQATSLNYAKINDQLTRSDYLAQLLSAFDENDDGIIDFEEWGKKGFWYPTQRMAASGRHLQTSEEYGLLLGDFLISSFQLKYSNEKWNPKGHDFLKEYRMSCVPALAYRMSQTKEEQNDPFFPEMLWGNGKWPSWQFAAKVSIFNTIYGSYNTGQIKNGSLYGLVFQFADKKYNDGQYTGSPVFDCRVAAADKYVRAVNKGTPQLDFIFYVPTGFGTFNNTPIPNIVETDDPTKIFTACFGNNREVW